MCRVLLRSRATLLEFYRSLLLLYKCPSRTHLSLLTLQALISLNITSASRARLSQIRATTGYPEPIPSSLLNPGKIEWCLVSNYPPLRLTPNSAGLTIHWERLQFRTGLHLSTALHFSKLTLPREGESGSKENIAS